MDNNQSTTTSVKNNNWKIIVFLTCIGLTCIGLIIAASLGAFKKEQIVEPSAATGGIGGIGGTTGGIGGTTGGTTGGILGIGEGVEDKTLVYTKMFTQTGGEKSNNSFKSSNPFVSFTFTAIRPFNLLKYYVNTDFITGENKKRTLKLLKYDKWNLVETLEFEFDGNNSDDGIISYYDFKKYPLEPGNYTIGLTLLDGDFMWSYPNYTSIYPGNFTNIKAGAGPYEAPVNGIGDIRVSFNKVIVPMPLPGARPAKVNNVNAYLTDSDRDGLTDGIEITFDYEIYSSITSYTITGNNNGSIIKVTLDKKPGEKLTFPIIIKSGLIKGEYTFTVTATNSQGNSEPSTGKVVTYEVIKWG